MKLFRKKEEKSCCCAGNCTPEAIEKAEQVKKEKGIKILGTGCTKCVTLENAARKAVMELELDISIEHISDITQIASFGVMTTPALVVNGSVVAIGKVLTVEEVKEILKKHIV